jgi:mono/diheme cytochrome c family protein
VKQRAMLTGLATLGLASFLLHAQSPTSTRDGVYTEAQATRGAAAYKTSCASCHRENLGGSGAQTPALVGTAFLANWTGQSLDELFERIQSSMPADHPGSLARAVNADILAYILQANKLPVGKTELPTDAGALKQIQFEESK